MTAYYKVLAQANPAATTLTTLYTVPNLTSTVASTLAICNLSGLSNTFRIAVRPAGEAIDNKHYLNYNTVIPANDTIFLTIGMTLATTDIVSVYSSTENLSFSLFGSEIY